MIFSDLNIPPSYRKFLNRDDFHKFKGREFSFSCDGQDLNFTVGQVYDRNNPLLSDNSLNYFEIGLTTN